jgi:protein-L-isoaspartate(D-aspartate) O-methyltransferase
MSQQDRATDPAEIERLHSEQVAHLLAGGSIRSAGVEEAFRAVPRHLFLPSVPPEKVYRDEAILTKVEEKVPLSSSSQPSLMAMMLEQLGLEPGERVLEIGTATGYNAALMAHIVGPSGHVVTIDIDEDLVEGAREHLATAGYPDVEVICRDGGYGWPGGAPYDKIILTVGSWDIAPAWIEQLAPGGRLVIPLALVGQTQESVAFEWREDHLESVSTQTCGFVHLRGDYRRPEERTIELPGMKAGLMPAYGDQRELDPGKIGAMLGGEHEDIETGIELSPREAFFRLMRWMELRAPRVIGLRAAEEDATAIPWVIGQLGKFSITFGLIEEESMAFLSHPPEARLPEESVEDRKPFPLWIRSYGTPEAAGALLETVMAWEKSGRLTSGPGFRVRAYPDKTNYHREPGDMVIEKDHVLLALTWD